MNPPPSGPPADRLPVLANRSAGKGRDGLETVVEALAREGVLADLIAVDGEEMGSAVREVSRRRRVVGVCGGDGTQTAAAEHLAGAGTALAVIPTGTLNHFARRLGLVDVADAARAIAKGATRRVPVGSVDDEIFLNTATFGLYADVVRRRERLRRWLSKWPAAGIAITQRLARMRQLQITLDVEGERIERVTPLLWVGIGWGSFPRAHQAPELHRAPELEIVILRPRGRIGAIGLGFRFIFHLLRQGRPVQDPALEVLHARSLIIHSDERIGVTLDGEVRRLVAPVFVGLVDEALEVIAPQQ